MKQKEGQASNGVDSYCQIHIYKHDINSYLMYDMYVSCDTLLGRGEGKVSPLRFGLICTAYAPTPYVVGPTAMAGQPGRRPLLLRLLLLLLL